MAATVGITTCRRRSLWFGTIAASSCLWVIRVDVQRHALPPPSLQPTSLIPSRLVKRKSTVSRADTQAERLTGLPPSPRSTRMLTVRDSRQELRKLKMYQGCSRRSPARAMQSVVADGWCSGTAASPDRHSTVAARIIASVTTTRRAAICPPFTFLFRTGKSDKSNFDSSRRSGDRCNAFGWDRRGHPGTLASNS